VDFVEPGRNDGPVVNQLRVIEGQHNRRPEILVVVNGLPLALIELKNAADEDATIWSAYAQLQTYKAEIPSLPHCNALLVVSDGLQARVGSLTASQEWFKGCEENRFRFPSTLNPALSQRETGKRQGPYSSPPPPGRGVGGEGGALPERRNIILIADEAHQSQYDLIDGFARRVRDALPNASFIGFTGTPIETTDANTRAVACTPCTSTNRCRATT
jgi:type I site-specific restriction-modification system R (restriction) subunit